jgi:hypothetical protein
MFMDVNKVRPRIGYDEIGRSYHIHNIALFTITTVLNPCKITK